MDFDINRELAEDAAEEYTVCPIAREQFANGWYLFCEDVHPDIPKKDWNPHFRAGYIAARDAPDD